MKFKIGDVVKKGDDIGRVVGIDSECYFILFENHYLNQNSYYVDTGRNYSAGYTGYTGDDKELIYENEDDLNRSCGFVFEAIKRATIPDTKIGRRLYKNRILKIQKGLIYLK